MSGQSFRRWGWVVPVLALADCLVMILSADFRGPWLDDFATFRFANPSVPLGTAWRSLWPTETNPPLFYWIAREGVAYAGGSLFARRMVNLLPLAAVLFWFAQSARRYPAQRLFLALFWLIATTSSFFIWDFSSYRSYFYQYAAELILLGAAALNELERRRAIDWFQLGSVPFLIDLHQVTALYAGVMLVLLVFWDLRRGLWARAAVFAAVAFVSALPLLAFTWMQQHEPASVLGRVTWIKPHGLLGSLWLILGFLPRALGQNWIALCAGLAALVLYRPRAEAASFLRLLGTAALLGTVLLLVASRFAPLIVDRYFSFLTASCACALAVALPRLGARHRGVLLLLWGFAAAYLGISFVQLLRDQRWNSGGDLVAALVAKCPTTRIHAGALPPNPAEQTGLAYLAAARHLTLLPVVPDAPGACPVLYWTEYLPPSRIDLARFYGDWVRAANARAHFGLSDATLAHTIALRSQNGIVLEVNK